MAELLNSRPLRDKERLFFFPPLWLIDHFMSLIGQIVHSPGVLSSEWVL